MRLVAVVATVALASGLAWEQGAIAKPKAAAVSVTGHGVATKHDLVRLLAGSARYAVYSRQQAVTTVLAGPYAEGSARPILSVRARSGKTVSLSRLSNRLQSQSWETSGKWLVAWDFSGLPHPQKIDVWNIATRTHRFVHVRQSVTTVAATPRGFVYAHGRTLHEWIASSDSFRSLGRPYAKQTIGNLAADGHELVVTGLSSGIKVMAYDKPGSFRALPAGNGAEDFCYAVDHAGAACTIRGNGGFDVGFLPLDGSAATRVASPPAEDFDGAMLSGSEVMFAVEPQDGHSVLYGFSPNHPTLVERAQAIDAAAGAYDKVLLISGSAADRTSANTVLVATSPRHVTKLFAIHRSPDTAAGFALTAHRVAFVSDLLNHDDPAQQLSIQAATLHDAKGRITSSPPERVAGRGDDGQVRTFAGYQHEIAASPSATVFARATTCCEWHAYVATASGTVALPGALDPNSDYLEAAGHLVLWASPYNPDGPIKIYNTKTGQTQDLGSISAEHPVSFALTPSSLVYGTQEGLVRRLDLTTGLTTTVYTAASPTKPGASYFADVYATDDWVAWHIYRTNDPSGGSDGMRNVAKHGPSVALPHVVFGISNAGVLLKDRRTATRTWFRPFGGAIRPLLSARQFQNLPQLAGHTLAWVATGGELKVEHYSY